MGWWEGGNDLFNACRVSVLQDEKVLERWHSHVNLLNTTELYT